MALQRFGHWGLFTYLLFVLSGCSNGSGSVEPSEGGSQSDGSGFTVGVTVSSLVGSGLVLQNNGGNDLAVSGNGSVAFSNAIAAGGAYNVTVLTQPSNPTQVCSVTNPTGTVANANVSNVAVTCTTPGAGNFAITGTVSGLLGAGLVLQNNQGDNLAIPADGEFSFATPLATGSTYQVSVLTAPTDPAQTCSVNNASGTVGTEEVSNVAVLCSARSFKVGGSVSGLSGSNLELELSGSERLAISGNGTFTFQSAIASGAPYTVRVSTQPSSPTQTCVVQQNATGTIGEADVNNVAVSCATRQFSIGGTVTGLSGSGLVLQLNGRNDYRVTGSGPFQFGAALTSGTSYVVSIRTQPTNPTQVCSVNPATATGTVNDSHVSNVAVSCTTPRFKVRGTVTGLLGQGLVLRNTRGTGAVEDKAIAASGSFTFDTDQISGSRYNVSVRTQPQNPTQTCSVASPSGVVGGSDVTTIAVTCATNTYRVGGAVTGLAQGSEVVLLNNGGDAVSVQSGGAFQFPSAVASGAAYNVTVSTQPVNPAQTCTVNNGAGTVTSANISNVSVSCSINTYTIGGSVAGLVGPGLVLQNNAGDNLTLNGDGAFTFATPVQSGGNYSVTIAAQPANPRQVCAVSAGGSGAVTNANVTSVQVTCAAPIPTYSIGGTVAGLAGSGLVLQNNGGEQLAVGADGSFSFPTRVENSTPYSVTVLTQPAGPTQICSVANGAGNVSGADVANIQVTCNTQLFTVSGVVAGLGFFNFGLQLQLNGGETLGPLFNGGFLFATPVLSGAPYSVTVFQQPAGANCTVTNGSGTIGASNVNDVSVSCN